jgi:hypothetical protein
MSTLIIILPLFFEVGDFLLYISEIELFQLNTQGSIIDSALIAE